MPGTNPTIPPTRRIARLVGPALIAITLTEAYNAEIFLHNSPAVVYLNGTVLFVVGLAIVQAHNVWVLRPPVMVTLLGWVVVALGLSRMVFPERALRLSKDEQGLRERGLYAMQGLLCVLGVVFWKLGCC